MLTRHLLLILAALMLPAVRPAVADSDPFSDTLAVSGGAALGYAVQVKSSLYRDGGTRFDLVPLYLYDGQYAYLHAYRAGLKLLNTDTDHINLFVAHRFEGFPYDKTPASMVGMADRAPGADVGISYQHSGAWGAAYVEYLHDLANISNGQELRVGYNYDWLTGSWHLRPYVMISFRDAKLNDYYYGVRPNEALPWRPAYMPGWGMNGEAGVYATYNLTERWRLWGGLAVTRWSQGVRTSPVVDNNFQYTRALGLMYDFSPGQAVWPEDGSTFVKLMYGKSTDCNLLPIMEFRCLSHNTVDNTRIASVEIGRPFIERINDWPLDAMGYVGLLHHDENGYQGNFWQLDAYMKLFFYGFPWDAYVRTRLGLGVGVSYAQRVPYVELRDQMRRGGNNSKLLNYMDPTLDFSVGDLIGVKSLHDTYAGFGVSHRSGIFGSSQLLGNTDGGSNYLYTYVEWKM